MAHYLHQLLMTFGKYLHYIWCKFSIMMKKNDAGTAHYKGAIWDKFSEQHQHQSIKKRTIFDAQLALFGANKMQI